LKYARGDKKTLKYWSGFIEHDEESRRTVALLRKLDRLFESREVSRVAPSVRALSEKIFERYMASWLEKAGRVAHLYFDSRAIPLPEGIRPSLMSERRVKYAVGKEAIEISVVPVFPGRFQITGRFDKADPHRRQIVRLKGRRTQMASVDEYGFFSFAAVNPGTYRLSVGTGEKKIVIPELTL
jgi:hypothetical protein